MKPHWKHRIESRAAAGVYLVVVLAIAVPCTVFFLLSRIAQ